MPFRDVETRRAYQRQWTRARRSGLSGAASTRLSPTPADMATAGAVLALLWDELQRVRDSDADPLARARCVAYIASPLLKAVETAELERRVSVMEDRILGGSSNGHGSQN